MHSSLNSDLLLRFNLENRSTPFNHIWHIRRVSASYNYSDFIKMQIRQGSFNKGIQNRHIQLHKTRRNLHTCKLP